MQKSIMLRLSEEEISIMNAINDRYHYSTQTLFRVLLREKYDRLFPAYRYQSKKEKETVNEKPWEGMSAADYCISIGGTVEGNYCLIPKNEDGSTFERASLSKPEEFLL